MSVNFTVIYDACVLYPAPLRDLLMRLALTDLFRARWTDMIHDEWTRNVLTARPDLSPSDLMRTRVLMDAHVRDCLVTGFEHLIPLVTLPDPNDRHVVAAAIEGGANLIVTFNLKDFPADVLKQHNLEAQHPDDFIFSLMVQNAARVCAAVASHRQSLRHPPKSVDEYLSTLLRQGLTQTVEQLREWTLVI
jgi:hypothetical protein